MVTALGGLRRAVQSRRDNAVLVLGACDLREGNRIQVQLYNLVKLLKRNISITGTRVNVNVLYIHVF